MTPAGSGQRPRQLAGDHSLVSGSVLGRRERESLAEWSPPTKVRLIEYAQDVANEYGMSEGQREELVAVSTLSTHKLVLVTFATLLRNQQADVVETLQTYLVSAAFKENVVGHVRGLFLDPKVSSYKIGFLGRLRHMRLNPGTYHIPQEYRASITTKAFTSAVSKAATGARSELKRKMKGAWPKKTSIYDLVKALAWKSSQEMTDEIWALCAWLIKLIDYQKKTKETGDKREEFWDFIDKELAERRDTALEVPAVDRAAYSSFIFEAALKEHLRLCPPGSKKKKSSNRLPAWQLAISRAIDEMEGYSQEELAGEENVDDELDPDEDPLNAGGDAPPP
ncbi:hypothetical protein FB451DRAFT_1164970 [Mycena latifolia]|nr:hypothetical protein FB451DRAFT_1164970 [Mycena latifolia]